MTDNEENPLETFKKLIKGRSFGTEEFGDDYESNVELKRKVELSFEAFKEKTEALAIPSFKKDIDIFEIEKKNDLPKIMGSEYEDKNQKPCEKCSELMTVQYNPCVVCSRETVDIRCNKCCPQIFDLCSPKCHDIFEGKIVMIEIKNKEGKPFIVIEDDLDTMVLTVTDHQLFYQQLTPKDFKNINKECQNCQEDFEEDSEDIPKTSVIPLRCCQCGENYSYLVACQICYLKSGLQYLCDEC